MAGSNGSPAQRGGFAPQQWAPESEDEARAREYERWVELQRAQHAQQARPHAGFPGSFDPNAQALPGGNGHYGQQVHGQHAGHVADPFQPRQPQVIPAPGGAYPHQDIAGQDYANQHGGGYAGDGYSNAGYGSAGEPGGGEAHAGYPQPNLNQQNGGHNGYAQQPSHYQADHQDPGARRANGQEPAFDRYQQAAQPLPYPDHRGDQFGYHGTAEQPGYPQGGHYNPSLTHPGDQHHAAPADQQHGQPQGYAREPDPAPQFDDPRAPQHFGVPQPSTGYAGSAYPGHDGRAGGQRPDAAAYDFSNYPPDQQQAGYAPQHPGQGGYAHGDPAWQARAAGGAEPGWDDHQGHGHWPPPGGHSGHGPGAAGGNGHPGAEAYAHGAPFDGHDGSQHGYSDDGAAEIEERRGPSTLVVVGALVGAIVAGGGLAVAYKTFGGGGKNRSAVAQIRAPSDPAKFRPKDAGGRKIDYSDAKSLNSRASQTPPPPVPTSLNPPAVDASADAGPKKVATTTIIVNRDGSVSPQAASDAAAAPPPDASSGVPGLLIDGLGPPPPRRGSAIPPPPPAAPQAQLPPPPNPAPLRAAPQRIADLPLPKVQPSPPRMKVPKRASTRDDLLAPKSGVGATASAAVRPASAGGSAGYVAVLASKRNRQDALNSFADLFQKFPQELAGRTPDVREVNLADKGVWYRLIAGPPGSRQAARDLCVKLKARGMKDCWPTSY